MVSKPLTPEYVQEFLLQSAAIVIDLDEAVRLTPLVAASRGALRRLERFDLSDVRPVGSFNPLEPYA